MEKLNFLVPTLFFFNGQTRHKIQKSLKKILFHLDFRICMDGPCHQQLFHVGNYSTIGQVSERYFFHQTNVDGTKRMAGL